MKTKLTELANKIVMVRKHQGGFISPPIAPFFPYVEPTRPLPLTYKSGQHTSAMIALFLPATYARKYALSDPGALDPSEMHITLAYLGKADQIPGPVVNSVHEFMELVSEHHPPLTGTINGCGRFCNGDDDGDPFFIIPDLPDLPNLRELIVLWLRGNDVPVGQDHGFTPHITLTYIPHTDPNPFDQLERAPVSFPTISLVLAGDRYDYPLNGGMETKADLDTLVTKHLSGKHSQKTHAGKKAKGRKPKAKKEAPKRSASGILKELPVNLGLMDSKKKRGFINQLSDLSTEELGKAFATNNKKLDNPKNDLELRNALIFGKMLEDATKKKTKKLAKKAALVTKIGARHTGAECAVIQKMHDLSCELGAECHPMSRRAGARHSHADQGMVQRIHDDCAGLGATCKALPAKDDLYHSQVLKEGDIIKGSAGSGNFGHDGRKGKLGGSSKGGGLRRIGAKKDTSPGKRKEAAKKFREKRKESGKVDAKAKKLSEGLTSRHKKALGSFKNEGKLGVDLSNIPGTVKGTKITKIGADTVNHLLGEGLIRQTSLIGPSGYPRMKTTDLGKQVLKTPVFKASLTLRAQSNAPNYEPASTPQRCKNCTFFRGDPGEDYCTRFDFTADQDYICDAWEAGRPDEIPGYVANKADLAALTEGVLKHRGLTY